MVARHSDGSGGQASSRPIDRRSGLVAVLSLFLLLLAFFVLLSTLSRFEATRTKAVLGSLDATFRAPDQVGFERRLESLVGVLVGAERLENVVTDILRTAIALDTHEFLRVGAELTATLRVSDFFEASRATARPGIMELAELLADAVAAPPAGLRYEVDILLHPVVDEVDLAVQRADMLAKIFSDGGTPDDGLAVGLTSGDTRNIRLVFRVLPSEFGDGVSFGADGRRRVIR